MKVLDEVLPDKTPLKAKEAPKLVGAPKVMRVGEPRISVVREMKGTAEKTLDDLKNADSWKDKTLLFYKRETMTRNIEDIAGKDAPVIVKKYIKPVADNETARINFLNKERQELKSLGIKARSKESKLLQQYGEGELTLDELKKVSPEWQKIDKANTVLRQKYDDYLTRINKALERHGYDPIPRRENYFRHFRDISDTLEKYGLPNMKADTLPTDINGLTMDFTPGKNFFASALERKGTQTALDAITGIDGYLEGASKLIYHTDDIQRLRALEKGIRTKYSGTKHLANFVNELHEYANILAGKKSMVDRSAAEGLIGRKLYSALDWIRKRIGSNMIGGNVSAALTNFIPLTHSLATTDKESFVKAMFETMGNVFKDDGFITKSGFLTRRLGSDPLSLSLWDKANKAAGWLFRTIDNFTSQTVTRAKYLEGIKKGLSEADAILKADDWAARMITDRSLGATPTLFNSKMLGIFTQFQTEVNNQISFMFKDIPRNFDTKGAAAALVQVVLYGYLFNELFEKVSGRRPAFDPLNVMMKAYEDYTNPKITTADATTRTIRNIADQLPFSSTFTGGRIPIGAAMPDLGNIAKTGAEMAAGDVETGQGLKTIGGELLKPTTYALPPTGGGQAKKTIEGLGAVKKQGVYNASGDRLTYPVSDTLINKIKGALFGKSGLKETLEYYREGEKPLGELQTKTVESMADKKAAYNGILLKRRLDAAELEPDKRKAYADIMKHFDNTDDITAFFPASVSRTVEVGGMKYELTPEQYAELMQAVIRYSKEIITNTKQYDSFKTGTPDIRYKYLYRSVQYGIKQALQEMKIKLYEPQED